MKDFGVFYFWAMVFKTFLERVTIYLNALPYVFHLCYHSFMGVLLIVLLYVYNFLWTRQAILTELFIVKHLFPEVDQVANRKRV